ncbi:hypothetical protein [Meridianimarinicoccus aquatilis]|uniref:Uncharacterized protein n=1 Tax=Meridianimarinicoccus aquatilis TaxID=2552766 RepID=A0A4R6AWP3_9RHOB|nr:hypothetical protein [Fluviibacterium aquatile]TDL88064.1 hypothetical protein E2L05_09180 [Fluviibacterium aquatile]
MSRFARSGGHKTGTKLRVGLLAAVVLLEGCGGGYTPLVAGTCRSGARDPAGNSVQVCTPRGGGDTVRIVTGQSGSWPTFRNNTVSGQPALTAAQTELGLAAVRFDPRKDEALWARGSTDQVVLTFAATNPDRPGRALTLRVLFRTADGAVLGYRSVPRP